MDRRSTTGPVLSALASPFAEFAPRGFVTVREPLANPSFGMSTPHKGAGRIESVNVRAFRGSSSETAVRADHDCRVYRVDVPTSNQEYLYSISGAVFEVTAVNPDCSRETNSV